MANSLRPFKQFRQQKLAFLLVAFGAIVIGVLTPIVSNTLLTLAILGLLVIWIAVWKPLNTLLTIIFIFVTFPIIGIILPVVTSLQYSIVKELLYLFFLVVLLIHPKQNNGDRKWQLIDSILLTYIFVLFLYYLLTSPRYLVGLASLRAHVEFVPLALIIPRTVSSKTANKVLTGLFWLVVIIALTHIIHFATTFDFVFKRGDNRALFGVLNPNVYGTVYATILILVLNTSHRLTGVKSEYSGKIIALFTSFIIVAALLISLSRRSIFAIIVTIPIGFLLFNTYLAKRKRVILVLTITVVTAVVFLISPDAVQQRMESLLPQNLSQETVRLNELEQFWSLYTNNPTAILTGQGFGAVSSLSLFHDDFSSSYYHNYYLRLLADSGIGGLGIFLLIVILSIGSAFLDRASDERIYRSALSQAIIVILISNMFGTTLSAIPVNMIFWSFIGLLLTKMSKTKVILQH